MSSFLYAVDRAKKKGDCPWLGRLSKEWNEKRDDATRRNNASIMRRFQGEYGSADPFVGSSCGAASSPPLSPPPTPPLPPATPDPLDVDDVVPLPADDVPLDDGGVFFGDPTPQDVIPLDTSPPPASPPDVVPVLSNPCTLVPSPGYSADDIARDCWVSQHGSARAVRECALGAGGSARESWCDRWGHPYGPAAADAAARAEFAARPLEATPASSPTPYVWSSGETSSGAPAAGKGLPWWAFALGGVALLGMVGAAKVSGGRRRSAKRRAA